MARGIQDHWWRDSIHRLESRSSQSGCTEETAFALIPLTVTSRSRGEEMPTQELHLAVEVEVSLQSEPPGIVMAIAHAPFTEATVQSGPLLQVRLLLTLDQANALSENLAGRAWELQHLSTHGHSAKL
jgi:hypothetical protein